jgi:hypothetical protein
MAAVGSRRSAKQPQIAQRDTERDADRHVDTAPKPLPVRDTEDKDGGGRCEIRHLMTEQFTRYEPRQACRYCALDDHESSLLPALDAVYGGCFTTLDRSVTAVESSQFHPLQGEGL